MERLKNRPDFLRAAKGIRRVTPAITLEVCETPAVAAKPGVLRVGFTACWSHSACSTAKAKS